MPEWLSIFLSPDLWESLTGPLWLTGNALFWSLALHALVSIPIAFWLARQQNVLTKLVGFVTTLPAHLPPDRARVPSHGAPRAERVDWQLA